MTQDFPSPLGKYMVIQSIKLDFHKAGRQILETSNKPETKKVCCGVAIKIANVQPIVVLGEMYCQGLVRALNCHIWLRVQFSYKKSVKFWEVNLTSKPEGSNYGFKRLVYHCGNPSSSVIITVSSFPLSCRGSEGKGESSEPTGQALVFIKQLKYVLYSWF